MRSKSTQSYHSHITSVYDATQPVPISLVYNHITQLVTARENSTHQIAELRFINALAETQRVNFCPVDRDTQ